MKKFKYLEAIVYEPSWWSKPEYKKYHKKHPIKYGEMVYYLGDIPRVDGHCLVVKMDGTIVAMMHTVEFRKAKNSEL